MSFIPLPGIDISKIFQLYFVELLSLIYILRKYSKNKFYILIILIFYTAIFAFAGKDIQNIYRIIILVFTLMLCSQKRAFASFKKGDNFITVAFVLFSLFYFYSTIRSNDNFTIILSQYSRYLVSYCLWFLVRKELFSELYPIEKLNRLIYDIFLMQIVISIAKLIIFQGKQIEHLVGSIAHTGGSDGTTIPIYGFIFLWFYRKGNLKINDWLFVVGLMLAGFLAGKRAVWFIVPLVIAAFMIYVPKLKMNKTLWITIILAPLAFYLGVRLTPTLNPENKVWGSFELDYTFDYADKYQFGDEKRMKVDKRAQGRGGATILVWNKLTGTDLLTDDDWFGKGLTGMYTGSYTDFNKLKFGVSGKGNSTGYFQTYTTTGFAGFFTTFLLFYGILWQFKSRRIRWVVMGIVTWEYFMYIGNTFRYPAYMFLIVYFIHYSNYFLIKSPVKMKNTLFPTYYN
ncbi:MAG: hypothetical protein WCK78_02990 [Paludibacter sp.]